MRKNRRETFGTLKNKEIYYAIKYCEFGWEDIVNYKAEKNEIKKYIAQLSS